MKVSKLLGTCVLGLAVAVMPLAAEASHVKSGGSGKCDSSSSSGSGKGKKADKSRNELRLQGRSGRDDAGAVAKAKYEEKNGRRKFTVEVENAQPGTQFEVVVKGRSIGTITANSFGRAKLELRPTPDDSNELPIPSDFPQLKAGDTVQVGTFAVTLAAKR